jgi:hypothetical protein
VREKYETDIRSKVSWILVNQSTGQTQYRTSHWQEHSTTFPAPPFSGSGTVTTIEELCEQWKEFSNSQRVFLVEDLGEVFGLAEIPGAI